MPLKNRTSSHKIPVVFEMFLPFHRTNNIQNSNLFLKNSLQQAFWLALFKIRNTKLNLG